MFGGNSGKADVVIRSIIGRGWGQGATHSQSFHSLLGHIPGLRILLPSTVEDAYSMTYSSLMDQVPTVIFEHRSLYAIKGKIRDKSFSNNFETPKLLREGQHITLAGYSYATFQLYKASEILQQFDITADVFDLRSLNLSNLDELLSSMQRTKYALFHDVSWVPFGANNEIISRIIENHSDLAGIKIKRLGNYFSPAPTSEFLETLYYPTVEDIVKSCLEFLGHDPAFVPASNNRESSEFLGPY
jgi:pyruvate dehydrogenase E1 component beta subunit